jgi:hypothetical protein
MNIFIHFVSDKHLIRWHVVENDQDTYKLASCGFNNQVTRTIRKLELTEGLANGAIVREVP